MTTTDDPDEPSIDALAARAASHERSAQEQLLRRIRPWVLGSISRRGLASDADVEDLCHDVLIHLMDQLHDYDPNRPFKPWATTLMRRKIIDEHRKRIPRTKAEDRFDTDRGHPWGDLPEDSGALIDLSRCIDELPTAVRANLLWGFLVLGFTAAQLERSVTERTSMVRRWLQVDLISVGRCLGLLRPGDPHPEAT